jgi:GDPmannose 4,6-dehydratase
MKRALICGVSGQDGAYLAKLLLDHGYEVFGTSRDAQVTSFASLAALGIRERVKTVSMASNDFRSVITALTKVKPQEIYNLSGQSSVGLSFEQPVEAMESISGATLNLLEAVRYLGGGMRYYHAGSSECFGDTGSTPATEETPFGPRSPYAVAKSAAHWLVSNYREAYGIFACTGILFNHESPIRPERFVTQKIVKVARRIAAGSREKLELGNTRVVRDWGWAPEYVEAMWLMLQQDKPDDYVVATGQSVSLQDFTRMAFEHVGLDWQQHVAVNETLLRPLDILESRGNPAKAARVLGWTARTRVKDVIARLAS